MDWQQKAAALHALSELSLHIRKPGDWYATNHVERKEGSCLCSCIGNGASPQEAVEDFWRQAVEEVGKHYLVINAGGNDRRAVKWNGFMWAEAVERLAA